VQATEPQVSAQAGSAEIRRQIADLGLHCPTMVL
jgi:hypothetical protein